MKLDPSDLYLKQYPDVKGAIEQGGVASALEHFLLYGRAEGRIWPDVPASMGGGDDVLDVGEEPAPPVAHACEAAQIAQGFVFIDGWVDDRYDRLDSLTLMVGEAAMPLRFGRRRRTDVDTHFGSNTPHEFGFWAICSLDGPFLPANPRVRMRLASGNQVTMVPGVVTRTATKSLFDTFLAAFGTRSIIGSVAARSFADLGRGAGQVLTDTYSIVRAAREVRSRCDYGTRAAAPAISFICVLFGFPHFLFQLVARFAQHGDVGAMEFIFASNSPEYEEQLNRDAEIAAWLFGTSVSVITMNDNTGFSHANNVAVRHARGGRICIINPDVFPVDGDAVRALVAMDDEALGRDIAGGRLYYADGTVMHEGMYFERDAKLSGMADISVWTVEHWRKGFPDRRNIAPVRVDAVSGALMLMTRGTYERLDGFREDFVYGHYEDADLCLRNEQEGGITRYEPKLAFWHYEGMGSVKRPEHSGSGHYNRWLFSKKWARELDVRAASGPVAVIGR